MWRSNLEFQLCWYVYPPRRSIDTAGLNVPTWSWLSVDKTVYFYGLRSQLTLYAIVTDAETRLSAPERFTDCAGMALRLRCDMIRRIYRDRTPSHDPRYLTPDEFCINLGLNPEHGSLPSTAYVLPIVATSCVKYAHGLILAKAAGQGKGVYERIGEFQSLSGTTEYQKLQSVDPEDCLEVIENSGGSLAYIIKLI